MIIKNCVKSFFILLFILNSSSIYALANDSALYNIDKYKLNKEVESIEYPFLKNKEVEEKLKNSNINYLRIESSFDEYIKTQEGKLHIISDGNKFINASIEDVRKFANIDFLSKSSDRFQFLELNKYRNININKLNSFFSDLPIKDGNIEIYYNKAEKFNIAAKKYNIDPIYLVAHTLIETGNGNSELAQGKYILLDENGKAVRDLDNNIVLAESHVADDRKLKVYNFFGIGAVDSNPLIGGLTYAYEHGWVSIDKTIEGSAKWISENYINSNRDKFIDQNTLYAMKWDFNNSWHQYATDVEWALKIARNMYRLAYIYEGNQLSFEIPLYSNINRVPIGFEEQKRLYYANSQIDLYNLDEIKDKNNRFNYGDEIYIYGYTTDKKFMITQKNNKLYLVPQICEDKLLENIFVWQFDSQGYYTLVNSITNAKVYGWFELYDQLYYFNSLGQMQTGWQYLGESWYYFADNGYMQTGWQYLGESWYYFADNGYMQTGWQYLGENWYYFYENGYMATNAIIDGFIIDGYGYSNK